MKVATILLPIFCYSKLGGGYMGTGYNFIIHVPCGKEFVTIKTILFQILLQITFRATELSSTVPKKVWASWPLGRNSNPDWQDSLTGFGGILVGKMRCSCSSRSLDMWVTETQFRPLGNACG